MLSLKLALRFLSRQKVFTIINGLGLALCLASCIVLGRYLYCQWTPDRHVIDPETCFTLFEDEDNGSHSLTSVRWAKNTYLEEGRKFIDGLIVEKCDIVPYPESSIQIGASAHPCQFIVVDSTFTHFFQYDVEGDASALRREDACWVSADYLTQLGLTAEEALDTTLSAIQHNFHIAGIFHHPDGEVILHPDVILPSSAFGQLNRMEDAIVRVRPDFDAEAVNQQLSTFKMKNDGKDTWGTKTLKIEFVPWQDIYLHHENGIPDDLRHWGNATLCWILSAVLLLIFVIGFINFINLNMVLWQHRQHETGVRRVFGRKKIQICLDLWVEHLLLISAAIGLAWLLVQLSTPYLSSLLSQTTAGTHFDLLITLGMVILLPPLAMLYPTIQQLHAAPILSMQQRGGSVQSLKARTIILGFQYFITISLIVMSFWMHSHLDFLLQAPLGFDADRVLLVRPVFISEHWEYENGRQVDLTNRDEITPLLEQYAERLAQSPCVEQFCYTSELPLANDYTDTYYNGRDEQYELKWFQTSPKWFEVFGIKLQEGVMPIPSSFWDVRKTGTLINGWLVDKTCLHTLGYDQLDGAVARRKMPIIISVDGDYGKELAPIQGIVNDHYCNHRTTGKSPCIYYVAVDEETKYWTDDTYLAIRCQEGQQQELWDLVSKLQKEIFPDQTPERRWMSDLVDAQYKDDRLIAQVYSLLPLWPSSSAVWDCWVCRSSTSVSATVRLPSVRHMELTAVTSICCSAASTSSSCSLPLCSVFQSLIFSSSATQSPLSRVLPSLPPSTSSPSVWC